MTLSRQIVRRWRELTTANVPATVEAAARLHLLDAIGVGIAASALPQGEPYRRFAEADRGAIMLLNGGTVAAAADAALVNGGLIHSLEFDDTHTASIVHGSAVLAPAVLAAAQAHGRSPDDALRAYIAGYEVLIRMGLAAAGGFQANGFQVTSVAGTLVTALIAADLAGADEDTQVHAIGIALSQASGVFEFLSNGSSVKSMHPGWAAHAGLTAAKLAMSGLTGPETAIEGGRGLFSAFARDGDAAGRLTQHLADCGRRWHVEDVAFKFKPCCHYLHPFVEAAEQLMRQVGDVATIKRLILRIAERAAPIVCEPWATKLTPPDGHAARWSLPVVVAMQLCEGNVDLGSFMKPASPAVLAMAARCAWEPLMPNRFPDAFEAEIVCELANGEVRTSRVEDVFGNARRPASADDVLLKFRANGGRCLPPAALASIESFCLTAGAADFRSLADALRQRMVPQGEA